MPPLMMKHHFQVFEYRLEEKNPFVKMDWQWSHDNQVFAATIWQAQEYWHSHQLVKYGLFH